MIEPLVCLPGLQCDARVFGPQAAVFSRARAVCVAPPVHGERIEEIASGLLDQLPRRFALVGHDLGGVVAMELMRRAPDRIARLALINCSPLVETPQEAVDRDLQIVRGRSGKLAEVMRDYYPFEHLAPGERRQELQHAVAEMALALGSDVFVRQSRALQRRRDQQSALRKCRVPAMVMTGERLGDAQIKRQQFLAELIPNATLQVIPRAAHMPMLEEPERSVEALAAWLEAPMVLR